MEKTFDLLVAICNRGFSDDVMDIVRERGATGGTILHGKGSSSKEMAQYFNITIHDEKEIILIVTVHENRDNLMKGIMENAGLATKAGAVVFSLPVDFFQELTKKVVIPAPDKEEEPAVTAPEVENGQ